MIFEQEISIIKTQSFEIEVVELKFRVEIFFLIKEEINILF